MRMRTVITKDYPSPANKDIFIKSLCPALPKTSVRIIVLDIGATSKHLKS